MEVHQIKQQQETYNSTRTIANPTAPNGYTVTLNDNGRTNSIVQTKNIQQMDKFRKWKNKRQHNIYIWKWGWNINCRIQQML